MTKFVHLRKKHVGGYVAKAVTFPFGQNNISRALSISNSSFCTVSLWLNMDDLSANPTPVEFIVPGVGFSTFIQIGYNFTSDVAFQIGEGASAPSFSFGSNNGVFTTGVWHHLFASCDSNHANGAKIGFVYVDGVSVLNPSNTFDSSAGAFQTPYSSLTMCIPDVSVPVTDLPAASVADVQVWTNQIIDPTSNISKFIAVGKPVDPSIATAAFGQQTFLFSGDHTTFPTNQGTGGAFTLTGTLTNASTSPSD